MSWPAVLQALLDAEVAAGNDVVERFSSFPAPPIGECVMLRRAVSTPVPEGISFRERNSSTCAGEFTDADRRYFILNPPVDADVPVKPQPLKHPMVERFAQSIEMNHDRWHDGESMDLEALRDASDEGRAQIESLLLSRPVTWREIEALDAVGTPKARQKIEETLRTGELETRIGVLTHAPGRVTDAQKIEILREALKSARAYGGLTQALLVIEEFHPPEIVDALFQGALEREGDVAIHLAAMLMFIHKKAKSSFDWALRPFFLEFNEEGKREAAFDELCRRLKVDPGRWRGVPTGEIGSI